MVIYPHKFQIATSLMYKFSLEVSNLSTNITYHQNETYKNDLRLRELLNELPECARTYFRAMDQSTSSRTRLAYAYDLRVFFWFMIDENPLLKNKSPAELTLDDLSQLSVHDIEDFMMYLKCYHPHDNPHKTIRNNDEGISRKISCLRSFFNYFYRNDELPKNPAAYVNMPKLSNKVIVFLEPDEMAILLDGIEKGDEKMSPHQKKYYNKTKWRDLAITTLILGTGIRVSECVGLDIQDVSFRENSIKVHRKGGNEQVIYFGQEVEDALMDYMNMQRNMAAPAAGSENALFLSMQNQRISVNAVQKMIVKYAQQFVPWKKITVHKLRSSYGTTLYQETGDLYLVSDVLGHKSVNTSKKYSALGKRTKLAASAIKLREKKEN